MGCLLLTGVFIACGGGGGSSPPPPPANNPVPSLTTISPSTTAAGGGPFTLTVNGSNFISSSTVHWNATDRTTTFVSATQLTAAITSTDIASPGTPQVTVFNPAPGGGTSSAVMFTITAPTPMITSLSPSSAVAGQTGFTLTVNGSNFVSNSIVQWSGSDRPTQFNTATQISATISQADVSAAGPIPVTVKNPGTPDVISSPMNFTVATPQPLAITTSSLPPSAANKNYHFVLGSTGGVPPLTWSIVPGSGALPTGLTLDPSKGQISGTVSGVSENFIVQLTDSANPPNSTTRALSIAIGSVARNDNVCVSPGVPGSDQPVPTSNGTLRASISPHGDIDTYSFTLTQPVTDLTIETFAQQLDIGTNLIQRTDFLDTVLELLNSNCDVVSLNDDIFIPTMTSGGAHIQDSMIVVGPTPFPLVPQPCDPRTSTISCNDVTAPTSLPAGTYFIRVRDFRGDGRPDLVYDLTLAGVK